MAACRLADRAVQAGWTPAWAADSPVPRSTPETPQTIHFRCFFCHGLRTRPPRDAELLMLSSLSDLCASGPERRLVHALPVPGSRDNLLEKRIQVTQRTTPEVCPAKKQVKSPPVVALTPCRAMIETCG